MAEIRARGIIIKQSDYGEGHRMLTVFTEEYGIVKAVKSINIINCHYIFSDTFVKIKITVTQKLT